MVNLRNDRRLMSKPSIRPASVWDLRKLAPSLGSKHFFRECLRSQRWRLGRGRHGLLLIATRAGLPVGRVYLRFVEADEPEIHEAYPNAPLLQHLEVLEEHRNRGIGTQLIAAAERALCDRGDKLVVLGVHPENKDAIRLYERLGYKQPSQFSSPIKTTRCEFLPTGNRQHIPDECCVLVKDLPATASLRLRRAIPTMGEGWLSRTRAPATVAHLLGRLFG